MFRRISWREDDGLRKMTGDAQLAAQHLSKPHMDHALVAVGIDILAAGRGGMPAHPRRHPVQPRRAIKRNRQEFVSLSSGK
jgi:hypothetical protein